MFILIMLACVALALAVLRWLKRDYIKKVSTSGYLADPPAGISAWFARRYCQALVGWQVGKVTVIGAENLNTPSAKLIVANHGHFIDPILFPVILDVLPRTMAAQALFQAAGGLVSLLAAPGGAFAVDLTKGKGGEAADAAVKVLTTGQTLVIFPEGWAWLDGHVEQFRKGAVRIGRRAAAELGQPCYYVPSYIRYGRYPGKQILRLPPPLQYLILYSLACFFRRGVTVVIGKPISTADLPADDTVATEFLRQKVLELDPLRQTAAA